MNTKINFRFLCTLSLALLFQNFTIAQCDPGTMDLGQMTVCDGESLTFIHNGDQNLDPGNVMQFVLHDNPGTTLGTVFEINNDPYFGYVAGLDFGTTYYVSAIGGNDDGSGNVDLAGDCLSVSAGTPTIFSEAVIVNINVTDVNCFGNADGTAICDPADLIYEWSDGSTGPIINNLAAGTYQVTITNQAGCTNVEIITITEPAPFECTVNDIVLDCVNSTGIGTLTCSGGVAPYSYFWSNGQTSPDIVVTAPGVYSVTVSDALGCTSETSFIVTEDINIPQINISGDFEIDCNGSVTTLDAGIGIDLAFQWSFNGNIISTEPSVTIDQAGIYCLGVTSLTTGCQAEDCFEVISTGEGCGTIKGKINLDENINCQTDPGEIGYEGWMVAAFGDENYFGASNDAGEFEIGVLPGDYALELFPPNNLFDLCENGIFTTVVDENDVQTVDFQAQTLADCPLLSVDISTPFLRRCFTTNYHVNYCNNGTIPAEDAYVIVTLDEPIQLLSATEDYIDLGNNQYQFDLGTVEVGDCGVFWIHVKTPCEVGLGETKCAEAHIYPDDPCDPIDPLWSGASVELSAECDGDSVRFTIENVGAGNMLQTSTFIVIEDGVMFMDEPYEFILESMQSEEYAYPANGSTWVLDAEQVEFHPGNSMPLVAIEGCGTDNMGVFSTGFVTQFAENDNDDFISIDCQEAIGAWDPNDKNGYPKGYGDEHLIERGQDIEYLIRFQNTGTDTAFNIVVEDVLSPYLDMTSMRLGASSHPYELDILGSDTLHFIFENIMLPDSNVNEPASHGFIKFRISQMPDLDLGTTIYNEAAIYFDFNDPVITNKTDHTIGEHFISNSTHTFLENVEIKAFPNPFEKETLIQIKGRDFDELTFELYDLAGKLVRTENFEGNEFKFRRKAINSGLFMYQIKAENQLIGTGKLVTR